MADTIDLLRPLRRARIKGWEPVSALLAWLYRGGRRTYERLRMAWKRLRYTPVPGIPSQIHLSWTQDPSTSLTMTWYTPSPDNPNLVEYRELDQADWTRVPGATSP